MARSLQLPMVGSIDILSTGGSFEKIYGQGAGVRDMSFPALSAAEKIVKRSSMRRVYVSYDPAQAKDSLDMGTEDRERIAAWCARHRRSIVVHGTDTMVDTAATIATTNVRGTVVLTGALQPACMRDSDAEFNLGGALIAVQALPPGVYIVMGGRIFAWDSCRKNPDTGHFEPLD